MPMNRCLRQIVRGVALTLVSFSPAMAQERLPWEKSPVTSQPSRLGATADDAYQPPSGSSGQRPGGDPYAPTPPSAGAYPAGRGAGAEQPQWSYPSGGQAASGGNGYGNQSYGARSYGGQSGAAPNYGSAPYGTPPYGSQPAYGPPGGGARQGAADAYRPPERSGAASQSGYGSPYSRPAEDDNGLYDRQPGTAYEPPRQQGASERGYEPLPPRRTEQAQSPERGYYTQNEILDAGHGFFGSVSRGLASAVEWAFQQAGRPNGYILGEDAGGAFVAGLRYGEGVLHTKDAGRHKIYWQGPTLGYDVGAEGSKTMVLVYNLRDISEIYNRFGGVQGAAYLIGGVSVQFQKYGDVVLAPIRSGVGVRLGANVGYLKYTRSPTWNPF